MKVTFLIENYKQGIHFSCCRHLGFRKTAAISLLFDRSSPKLVETLGLRFEAYRRRRKCIFGQIQEGGRRHLEFPKKVAISLLFDQSSPNLVALLLL